MTHILRYKCIAAINDFLLAFFEIIVLMENVKKVRKKLCSELNPLHRRSPYATPIYCNCTVVFNNIIKSMDLCADANEFKRN